MPTTCQEKNEEKYLTGWGAAIADARRRIADLQFSLPVFERQKKEGRPWSGDLLDRPPDAAPRAVSEPATRY
jgi:hypothetical protein